MPRPVDPRSLIRGRSASRRRAAAPFRPIRRALEALLDVRVPVPLSLTLLALLVAALTLHTLSTC